MSDAEALVVWRFSVRYRCIWFYAGAGDCALR